MKIYLILLIFLSGIRNRIFNNRRRIIRFLKFIPESGILLKISPIDEYFEFVKKNNFKSNFSSSIVKDLLPETAKIIKNEKNVH